ncbi:MAG: CBS domain-containing protein [Planctomycetes bacterium]|nr:CBS domain-containing protein [Planctomycetota bacterium]
MNAIDNQLLTAGDLMSRDVETVGADAPLREAAEFLIRCGVHGAPVVDGAGRCVGVLSVTDLARWASGREGPKVRPPRTCAFQEKCREPGGRETVLCRLAEGACPMQRLREMADGKLGLACIEPNSVPVDWQTVELEALPSAAVRDFMTTTVITADPSTPVHELARLMLDHEVHRLIVLDAERHPVGVVAVNDLLQVMAHPEIVTPGVPL